MGGNCPAHGRNRAASAPATRRPCSGAGMPAAWATAMRSAARARHAPGRAMAFAARAAGQGASLLSSRPCAPIAVIPHGFLWSIVPPAIRSREMANCEAQVEAANIPVLGRVYQRTAFSSLFSFMTTLDELPPSEVSGIDKAKGDAIRLAEAIGKLVNPTGTTTVEVAA